MNAARKEYLTRKKREQRAAAKADGRCQVCAKNPVTGKATCDGCIAEIVSWQRANGWPKAAKKAAPTKELVNASA